MWTDAEFVRAVREGIGRRGEHLDPAMPYAYYTRMPVADVIAIRAHLTTVVPVANPVDEDQLPFPLRIRSLVAAWNKLHFRPGEFASRPNRSAEWNRGAYLVEGPGHCGGCRTPKSRLGGDDSKRLLAGGELEGWFSSNLRDDRRTGLGAWSIEQVSEYLLAGSNSYAASGPMAEVVANSTSRMSRSDIDAVALYLKSRPTLRGDTRTDGAPAADVIAMGEAVYVDACASCHGRDGVGIAHLFPPMKGSPIAQSEDPASLIRAVLHGTQNAATDRAPTGASMPPFGWTLTDGEISAAVTYVRRCWGNAASTVTAREVTAARRRAID